MSLRQLKVISTIPYDVPEIVDITDQLPRKSSWETLPKKQNIVKDVWDGTYHTGLRKPEDIDTIVVHHSGSPEGTLKSHANYHSQTWGAGISYHVSIDEGLIKQLNNLLSFTFHVSGNNTYTVAIEVNRDLSKGDLTDRERELLYAAILTVKSVLPIQFIKGHNELNPTACPVTSMNRIRDDIKTLEMKMLQQDTWEEKVKKVSDIGNQYNFMTGKIKEGPNSGDAQWGMNYLLKVRDIMIEQKLL